MLIARRLLKGSGRQFRTRVMAWMRCYERCDCGRKLDIWNRTKRESMHRDIKLKRLALQEANRTEKCCHGNKLLCRRKSSILPWMWKRDTGSNVLERTGSNTGTKTLGSFMQRLLPGK
ncbi:hypothetical protein Dsin_016500 [Dipteronia sinensis]|uniref:Uncharacterized protein n=1 Tax=Dipteronia sinensis TaxID=43782 RepID=A0AAE0ADC6_9ROSI|nr:hypothetical protein Dsin_016500 [Dipteronia sinensis]